MKRLLFLLLMASAQINAAQPSSNRPVTVSISMGKDLDPFVEITNANFIKENTLLQDEITSNPDVKNHNIILEPSHRVTKEGIEILEKLTGKSMEAARDMIRLLEAESLADALLNAEFLGNKYLQEILTMLAKKLRYEGLNSNLETLFDTQGKDGNYTIHSAIRKELIKEILKLL